MSGFDESVDFLVVGCGGGSMCAGLVMRDAGKSVLILEKSAFVGGTTAKSGGVMWIPNNRFMKRDGIEDSPEKAMTYLDSVTGDHNDTPGATRARRQAYVTNAPRMIDYLVEKGIKLTRVSNYPDYYDERPGGVKVGRTVVAELFDLNQLGPWKDKFRPSFMPVPAMLEEAFQLPYFRKSWKGKKTLAKIIFRTISAKLTGKHYVSVGLALQARMLQAALKAGIEIRTESPVTELIIENGRATGVVTVKDGRVWRVGAKLGILINAGGFAHNQKMRDQYQPGTRSEWSNAIESDTGDLIQEMMRHGAAIAQMEEMVGYPATLAPGWEKADVKPPAQSLIGKPHAILVDQSGVRYLCEGGSYMAHCKGMLERDKTVPAVPSWAIFDQHYIENYMLAGTMPGAKKPAAWTDTGYLRKADSIAELAGQIKVDPATLKGTIERFNGFVDKGRDEDFHRGERAYDDWLGDPFHAPNKSLGRIDKGPFYAVPVVPGDVSTFGGVVTDDNARVLKEDGLPIDGLYATGTSTAAVTGRAYGGAGSSVGPSFTFGYVAAHHLLETKAA